MKTMRVWAMTRKEAIHIVRDPRSLIMGIAIPMLMLFLFGYALTLDVNNVPVVFWDQSGTADSREFRARFDGSPYFSVIRHIHTYSELERALDKREALAALVIPTDFSRTIHSHRVASVQFIVDGSDSNTASLAMGYADAIVSSFSLEIQLKQHLRSGGKKPLVPVDLRSRVWFNADLESRNYIIPGLIAVIMMVIAAQLTSLTVAREWETGTMEQLISTPVKGKELILGKLIPYFAIGLLDVLVAVLMGEFVFQVPLRGNVGLLFASASVFLIGALALGMTISIATKNQLLASQLSIVLTFLPAFLLSGFAYDILNMPKALQIITHVVPARYFVTMLKAIYLKGLGLQLLLLETVLLSFFAFAVVVLANRTFKKQMV